MKTKLTKDEQLYEALKKAKELLPKNRKLDLGLMIECFAKIDFIWDYMNVIMATAVARKDIKNQARTYTLEELKELLGLDDHK